MTLQEQIEIQQTLSEILNKEGLLRLCIETTLTYGYNGASIFLNDRLNDEIHNIEDYELDMEIPYDMTEQYHNLIILLFSEYSELLQSLEVENTTDKFGDDLYIYNETEYDFYPQMVEDILENIMKKDLVEQK